MTKRILIIDDEEDLINVIRVGLIANGYEVISSTGGLDGLERAKKDIPNLILLDVMMPHFDGFSVLRELKASSKTASIPTIMLTGKDDAKSLKIAKSFGATDFITKPFNVEALLDLIKKVIPE